MIEPMFGFGGLSELMFIFFLAMLIFGPEKLPEIGRMLAKGMAEVRKASNELKRTLNAELAISEQEIEARRRAAAPPPIALASAVPMAPEPTASPFTPPAPCPPAATAASVPWDGTPAPAEAPAGVAAGGGAAGATEAAAAGAAEGAEAGAADHAAAHPAPAQAPEASEAADVEGYEPRGHETAIGHEPLGDRSDIVPEPR
jgi:Sec-independent protein translocase protein TatA